MPLPKPKKNEDKKKFINRCMGDPVMVKEYEQDQRFKVCQSLWDKEQKMAEEKKEIDFNIPEIRYYTDIGSEVRKEKDQPTMIIGYGAVFNERSQNLGGFVEKIKKGAFAESLEKDDVVFLRNHSPDFVLGRFSNKKLEARENTKGLYYEVEPPDTTWAKDLIVSVERKDMFQNSFAFRTIEDSWDNSDPKLIVRTLLKVKLVDISIVTFPAYTGTTAKVRSLSPELVLYERFLKGQEDLEEEQQKLKEQLQRQFDFRRKRLSLQEKEI